MLIKETMSDILYARTGYRDFETFLEEIFLEVEGEDK